MGVFGLVVYATPTGPADQLPLGWALVISVAGTALIIAIGLFVTRRR
jgi:hypothetical protein